MQKKETAPVRIPYGNPEPESRLKESELMR